MTMMCDAIYSRRCDAVAFVLYIFMYTYDNERSNKRKKKEE